MYKFSKEIVPNNLCNHYSKPELPNSWAHQRKTAVKRPGAIQGLLIGTEGERHSAIVPYPSETTPGLLYIILILTAKNTFEEFQIGTAAEKGCEGDPLTGSCRVQKILHLVSLAEKKSQEDVQILSINTDETSSRKGKEPFI